MASRCVCISNTRPELRDSSLRRNRGLLLMDELKSDIADTHQKDILHIIYIRAYKYIKGTYSFHNSLTLIFPVSLHSTPLLLNIQLNRALMQSIVNIIIGLISHL